MPPQVWAALIGAVGVLVGVGTGSFLSAWYQRQAWKREHAARLRDERRQLFADFLTAARDWRAVTQHPDTKLISASAVSKSEHADGGAAAARTLALRSEIAMIAQAPAIRAARDLSKAHTRLAEGRSKFAAGSLPESLMGPCRRTELLFVHAAREELGVPTTEAELEEAFGLTGTKQAETRA